MFTVYHKLELFKCNNFYSKILCTFYKWNKWFWLGKAVTKTGSCPNNTRSFSQRAEGLGSPFSVQYTYNLYSKSEVFWEWETLFKLKKMEITRTVLSKLRIYVTLVKYSIKCTIITFVLLGTVPTSWKKLY